MLVKRSLKRPVFAGRDVQKRPTKETYKRDLQMKLIFVRSSFKIPVFVKKDLQRIPTKETKESYKRN